MKRLIASFAALGLIAAPAMAVTKSSNPTPTAKQSAKAAAKAQKKSAKLAAKSNAKAAKPAAKSN